MSNEGSNKPRISVKASFEGELRRFSIERPFAFVELYEKVLVAFGLKDGVGLKYLDDEGDYVSISREDEVEEAIRICLKASKENTTASVLRIEVGRIESPKHKQNQEVALVKLAKFRQLKMNMREQRQKLQEERREKIQAERKAFAVKLAEKRKLLLEKLTTLRQQSKAQRQEAKKLTKEQLQTLKQEWKCEKMDFKKQIKHLRFQMREQCRNQKLRFQSHRSLCCAPRQQPTLWPENLGRKFLRTHYPKSNLLPTHQFEKMIDSDFLCSFFEAMKKQARTNDKAQKKSQKVLQAIANPTL